jgi:hypothetical protein
MKRKITAFVHIKKAAGTSLIHILRVNFFLRYCDVQILCKNSKNIFQAEDMRKLLKVNPFVKCIGGHDIKPYGNLVATFPGIRFITILREPIQRYISQHQYNTEKLGQKISFNEYLENPTSFNKQTRAIAGSDNIVRAKNILKTRFFLVGIVEEFDEFLVVLKKKISPLKFRIGYRQQNISSINSRLRTEILNNLNRYRQRIIERNILDIELYNYAKNEIFEIEKKEYGPHYEHDVSQFKNSAKKYSNNLLRYLDYIFRKAYYEPMFRFIRKFNGLG